MEFRILGPLEVIADGRHVELPPQLRKLLSVLLLEANSPISSSRLAELIADKPSFPAAAEGTLRSHVRRLRQRLEPQRPGSASFELILHDHGGYRIRIGPDQLDAQRFERLVQDGRGKAEAGNPTAAAGYLQAALALWRGPVLADIADQPFVLRKAEQLNTLRLAAVEELLRAKLDLRRPADAIGHAQALLIEYPDNDGLRGLVALALYRSGRAQDAAQTCREGLERAAAQGRSPPLALQDLQRKILDQSPDLPWAPAESAAVEEWKPTAVWHVPVQRQRGFTGRDRELARLEQSFADGERVQIIYGLAGIGKTQLAVQYAHRNRPRYRVVWWVDASEPGVAALQLSALAEPLDLPALRHGEPAAALESVRQWLGSHDDWLLVLDGARDPAAVQRLLPDTDNGYVLITSTNPNWTAIGRSTRLRSLTRRSSVKVLTTEIELADQASAGRLARALHDLPLALQQARAYMTATGRSVGHYLELLEEHPERLLAHGLTPDDHRSPVVATWGLALEQVKRTAPAGVALMNLCSVLAPEDLPLELLVVEAASDLLPEPLARLTDDKFENDRAMGALHTYSLIEMRVRGPAMHQLLQTVVRRALPDPGEWIVLGARLLARALPGDVDLESSWPIYRRLLPSLLVVCSELAVSDRDPDTFGWLLDRAATWSQQRGRFEEAERLFRRSLDLRERTFGPDDIRTLNSLNNLGLLLTHRDIDAAKRLLSQAITGCRDLLAAGSDQRMLEELLADCLNNLGWAEHLAGDDHDAIAHLDEALGAYERLDGQDAQLTGLGPAHAWMNRGVCLLTMRSYSDAEESFLRALELLRAGKRDGGSDEATIWNNLAVLALAKGQTDSARARHEKALNLRQRLLGKNHPRTAISLLNLGAVHRQIGQESRTGPPLETALDLHHAALEIFSKAYDGDHHEIAQTINNLGLDLRSYGMVLRARGEWEAAEEKFRRAEERLRSAYDMRRRLNEAPHPELVQSLDNIGAVLRELGRYDEAIRMHEQSLAMTSQLNGVLPPAANATLEHLALAHKLAGNGAAARRHALHALQLVTDADGAVKPGFERVAQRLSTQLEQLHNDSPA